MSTITAILEPDADGTLHLPLPAELRHGKVRVEAKIESAEAPCRNEEQRKKELLEIHGTHSRPEPISRHRRHANLEW